MGRRKPSRRGVILFGGVFVLLGFLAGGVSAARALREWEVKRTWQQTPCTITKAEYELAGRSQRRKRTRYVPVIEYRYNVSGRAYTSGRFSLRRLVYLPRDIGPLVQSYPVGSTHTCYVSPSDPSQAVLRVQEWPYRIGMLMGMVFVGLGGLVMWSSRRIPR